MAKPRQVLGPHSWTGVVLRPSLACGLHKCSVQATPKQGRCWFQQLNPPPPAQGRQTEVKTVITPAALARRGLRSKPKLTIDVGVP